jgi:hypothetical protein
MLVKEVRAEEENGRRPVIAEGRLDPEPDVQPHSEEQRR